jgi:hypothetical protein
LRSCLKGEFGPFFLLQENYNTHKQTQSKIPITAATIEDMCNRGLFNLVGAPIRLRSATQSSLTRISLCLQEREYPHLDDKSCSERYLSISSFPRSLRAADTTTEPLLSPSTAATAPVPQDPPAEMLRTEISGSDNKRAGRRGEDPATTSHRVLERGERRRLRRWRSFSGTASWSGSVRSVATTVDSRPATSATDSDSSLCKEWK